MQRDLLFSESCFRLNQKVAIDCVIQTKIHFFLILIYGFRGHLRQLMNNTFTSSSIVKGLQVRETFLFISFDRFYIQSQCVRDAVD